MNPLVLTVQLAPAIQSRFDAERARFFPPGRTQVGAHITLFHALPGAEVEQLLVDLTAVSRRPPFDLAVTGLMALGHGVAYRIESTTLHRLHRGLQQRWQVHLSRQDQHGFRPHVTVQNKVDVATARRTQAELEAGFQPFATPAVGLQLWDYLGGPWQLRCTLPFQAG
ncbi:MAG TPA: 2'-5' RNA ligase family protein [Jatrophihabitans sp.]|nr:2'-5' RNA ligase family protein [Jatrophihabitans sp.]